MKETEYIKCAKCHSTEWQNYKCVKCGNSIDNSYIGSEGIYKQLCDIVTGNK
jgi:DNA-directed RNA polymerase subunit RPC12/RpoP